MSTTRRFGLSAAMCLPLDGGGAVDVPRLLEHARRCLGNGCDSVTLFGTTGEGASLGEAERERVLDAFVRDVPEPRARLVGGVSASAVDGAVAQATRLLDAGCRALLLPPPFYFKDLDEDGVFVWYARVFERLGPRLRDVLLYHIPSVTAVPLSTALVTRLRDAFPGAIVGVKDSSGDFANTRALLDGHGDLAILVGDERTLADGVALGAEGAISGIANVCPDRLARVVAGDGADDAVLALVDAVLRHPVVPAVKALVAHRTGDDGWRAVLPPLSTLEPSAASALGALADAVLDADGRPSPA